MSTLVQARLVDQPIWTKELAWELRGPDLTRGGRVSLSKALLGSCLPLKSGEDVYANYFKPFTLVDMDANLSCLKSRPDQERKIRNSMYNTKDPTKDPAYFNFTLHTDVNRLAKVIGKEIVVYLADDRRFQFLELYHDFRVFSPQQQQTKECLYYVVTVQGKLFKFRSSLDNIFETSAYFFGLERSRLYGREDYGILLARLLKVSAPNFPIKTLLDLAFCTSQLYELWQKKVLLVTFCKSTYKQRELKNSSRRFQPRFSYFFNLGLIGPPQSSAEAESVRALNIDSFDTAICFYAGTFACVLKDPYRRAVIEQYKQTTRRDKPSSNNFAQIPTVTLEEQRVALATVEAKKAAKKKKPCFEKKEKKCSPSCKLCSSDSFALNMNDSGPERLCSYFLDLSDLMKLMGVNTPEHLSAVERMCELSVASMDIESMTVKVDLEPPVNEIGGLRYDTIDSASLEGHFKKVQKPIMIAHLDEVSVNNEVTVFQAESDAEESIYKMMRDYWAFVKGQQLLAIREKNKLAAPLLTMLQDYKNAHFDVYSEWCQDNMQEFDRRSISQAWKASLPGQLERRLLRLVSDYTVFSFYG